MPLSLVHSIAWNDACVVILRSAAKPVLDKCAGKNPHCALLLGGFDRDPLLLSVAQSYIFSLLMDRNNCKSVNSNQLHFQFLHKRSV